MLLRMISWLLVDGVKLFIPCVVITRSVNRSVSSFCEWNKKLDTAKDQDLRSNNGYRSWVGKGGQGTWNLNAILMTYFSTSVRSNKMILCSTGTDFKNVTQHKTWPVFNCNYMCNVLVDIFPSILYVTGAKYMYCENVSISQFYSFSWNAVFVTMLCMWGYN